MKAEDIKDQLIKNVDAIAQQLKEGAEISINFDDRKKQIKVKSKVIKTLV